MAVARALRDRGHEAAVYVGGDGAKVFSAEGFRVFPYARTDWPAVRASVEELIARRRQFAQLGRLWKRFLIDSAPAQIDDVDEILSVWPADAILCDLAMCGPFLVTREQRGIPVALLSHVAGCLLPGPRGPSPGSYFARDAKGLARLLGQAFRSVVSHAVGDAARSARELRRRYGLEGRPQTITELSGGSDLYLQPSARELDYFRDDLPPNVHYVGACLWPGPSDTDAPAWIESIPNGRPWALAEEGALYTEEAPLLEAATRLTSLPFEVIVLRGEGRAGGGPALTPGGPNIHIRDWTALAHLLPRTEVVVSNANSDSVLFALSAGKPIVAVPSIWDQIETSRQIQSVGAGVRLPLSRCKPSALHQAIVQVTSEPSYREAAARMALALRPREGAANAAVLLEGLVQRGKS